MVIALIAAAAIAAIAAIVYLANRGRIAATAPLNAKAL